jgi:prephenate dehydrogenase
VKRKAAKRPAARRRRPLIGRLAIFGVGLIGGSFALALKRARAVGHVVGVGRTRANLLAARRRGIIDEIATDPASAVRDEDLVLIATPLRQMGGILAAIAPHLGPRTVVTDAGSTKQFVIAVARSALGTALPMFVPAHPIAGTEKSGARAALADLYRGRNLIVTPIPGTEPRAQALVERAWRACGMRVLRMDAAEHDRVFAHVSHLPHLLAFAMVDLIAAAPGARRMFGFAAGGFRDFTRIAASSPEMWRDICATNREAILAGLDAYQQELEAMYALVEQGDLDALTKLFGRAREARTRWVAAK